MAKPHIEDCVRAVLPPGIAHAVRAHYGRAYLGKKAMAGFCKRFNEDAEFRDRIMRKARELMDVIFDDKSDSWGDWPSDPQECAGLGLVLGKIFHECVDSIL